MKAANGVHRYEQPPVPLPVAVRLLRRSLERLPTDQAACLPDNWRILRLEVPLAAAGPQVKTLLNWLTCQRLFPRALFAARDGSLLVAGAGAAHVHRTGASPEPLLPQLGLAHENIRYIGGARFDGDVSGSEWALFGKSYWMLPRVEIAVQPVVNVSTGSAEGSEASSTPGTPVVGAQQAEGRMLHNAVLALQLRWCEDSEQSLEVEREKALQALDLLRPIEPSGKRAAVVASRCDTVSREDFEARVREALDAFAQKKLSKVVLARRMLLNLVWREDAPELMRQVVGASYKRHYLFLLEPQEGTAFISLSPERLCKVRGRDVWTEAVAGTWPITEFQKIGEAALLASSAKHSSEHQMVVDYICKLLDDIASHVKVCDTHILKLKHLVHIKQSYHALAKQGPSGDPFNLATFFCERMSPTPAVCGLPTEDARNFINQAEPWDRGFYAAPCGVLSAESCELIVALRSALLTEGRKLHVYAGAGVVEGSDPSEEFEEISLKMRQFTEAFANAEPCSVPKLMQLPNLNTLWATVIVEELVRLNVCNFVICPGSRSTPLVVAVARHQQTRHVVNHDERSGGFYALGWAKGINEVVAVIVTSGTAVANLLPAAVEAAQAQVPLLLLTADRPAELRDTGANQTIHQPGIFGCYTRWAKDFPAPSCEYSLMALLGDIDLAVAHSKGQLNFHPGPVHLNFCFRENLAPDGGPVRGAPGKSSQWDKAYVDFRAMHRWASSPEPRSRYIRPEAKLPEGPVLEELVALAQRGARILILVGTLKTPEEVLLSEDIASRLGAAVFADITSGLRQRPSAVHCSDQLLISELLASHLLQLDAIVQLGGPMTSARHNGAVKAGAPLYVRVAPAPVRMDQDHVVTHHLPCSLAALANALAEASLVPRPPSAFWKRLSSVAAGRIERSLDNNFNEPMVAQAVSRLLGTSARLLISSSMPIRDLDFFSKAYSEVWQAPIQPAMANRGASGIDGVISTAAGICAGCEVPCTLVIGDVASIQDINAFQLLGGSQAPPLTVVLINNGGGGIFSFLPISKHKDVMSPFFNEPHEADFQSICNAFNVPHVLCNSLQDFEAAYVTSQSQKTGCVIEVQPALNFEENVMLHKQIGQDVARAVRDELVSQVKISWCQGGKAEGRNVLVLLHGWMGQKADWKLVSQILMEEGCSILALDLPGHGDTQVADGSWEASALYSMPLLIEVLKQILDQLQLQKVIMVGYSLGGRVAMGFADSYPERCAALMVLSANPGVLTEEERHQRWLLDQRHAKQLTQQTFEAFLDSWYAAPLWAGLKERRPDVYSQMLEKRRQTRPHLAAHSLLGLSLASQPNFRPHLGQHVPFWYVFGELDSKFAEIGKDLAACSSKVHSLPCGHAVVEECPREVADLLLSLVKQLPSPSAPKAKVLQLTAAWTEPIQLLLKAPLLLSRGDLMPQRSGVLLVLQAQVDGAKMAGLGEVTPLPLFHKETLDEAESQLNYILAQWNSRPPKVPFDLGRLDGTLTKWLDQQCTGNLLPSVRAGLEMALLHLLRRAPEGWRRPQRSDVSINSLLARDEDLAADTALVAKFKVGKEPLEDAERTNQLAKLLLEKRPQARLRLDANRSWSLEQAASFINNLDEQALQITEYLEEPVQQSPQLLQHWEVLSEKTERRLAFAVDESLTEGIVSTKDLESCKAPIKALVLKPSLQGLEQTAAMAKWADEHGAVAVLSSAFESGVALCHFALLASMLAPCWAEDVAQGFGTFTRLSEDVLEPPFADLVSVGHKGWQVNIGSCQEALDRSVEALVAARQGTELVDGPSLAKKKKKKMQDE